MRQQETHVSNDRLFPSLSCKDEEYFERLFLHTAVRCFSKGAWLSRFQALNNSDQLAESVKPFKNDVAYLADIFQANDARRSHDRGLWSYDPP